MLRVALIVLLALAWASSASRASSGEEYQPEAVVALLMERPELIRLAVDEVTAARQAAEDGRSVPPPDDPLLAYLVDNPELILEAIDRYEAAGKIAAHAAELFGQPDDPTAGNPDGTRVLVVFTDYNCPYCQQMVPVLQQLAAEDPELRIVYKEMPILAESSWYAAQVALAANAQGKYEAFHQALFGVGARSEDLIDDIAGLVEVDLDDVDLADYDPRINANLALGQALGLAGTPSFVVGNRIFVGQMSYEDLKAALDPAGASGPPSSGSGLSPIPLSDDP
jgi:protein-disulfide isomerase